MKKLSLVLGSLLVLAASSASRADVVAPGSYEGADLEIVVTSTGATLNTGCQSGKIATPLQVGEDGSIKAAGSFTPILPENPSHQIPITIEGKYSPTDATLSVSVVDQNAKPEQYTLVLNGPKNLEIACPR